MNPYWIKAEGVRLGIMARPRGHDWLADDIRLLKTAGVNIIVSALTTPETEELELEQEAPCCRDEGILFLAFPIEDRSVPTSPHDFNALLARRIDRQDHDPANQGGSDLRRGKTRQRPSRAFLADRPIEFWLKRPDRVPGPSEPLVPQPMA